MTLLRFNPLLPHRLHRTLAAASAVSAAALLPDHHPIPWTPAPLIQVSPAAHSLSHIAIDVSLSPDLPFSYTTPGQYLQLRLHHPYSRPSFFAIASSPSLAASKGIFEFLVKPVPGSTAERLCTLQKGDVVELSPVMGKGFEIDRISPPDMYQTVLIFATGSAIRLFQSPSCIHRYSPHESFHLSCTICSLFPSIT